MNKDLLNILSDSNKDIDNQQLMDYLSGRLSDKERHEVEQKMAGNELLNDAVEGLQGFSDKKNVQAYVDQLNAATTARINLDRPTSGAPSSRGT